MSTGLFIGRFQPFHNGHLADIKSALTEVDELYIGIGSSQESHTADNPFTVEERKSMITSVLEKEKITKYSFFEIPDFNDDEKWVSFIEAKVPKIDIVYTGNDWTERCFAKKGYAVKRVTMVNGINSTNIRENIKKNEPWQDMVPEEIVDYVNQISGIKRINDT